MVRQFGATVRRRRNILALAITAPLSLCSIASADRYWRNGITADTWSSSTDWNATSPSGTLSAGAPGSSDNAFLANSDSLSEVITLDETDTVLSLGVGNTGGGSDTLLLSNQSLELTASSAGVGGSTATPANGIVNISNGELRITNGLTISPGGTINLSSSGMLQVGTLTVQSGGNFNWTGGSLLTSGLTVGSGGLFGSNLTLNSSQSLGLSTLSVSGTLTNNADIFGVQSTTVNQTSGTFTENCPLNVGSEVHTYNFTGGTLQTAGLSVSSIGTFTWGSGTLIVNGPLTSSAGISVPNGGTFTGSATVDSLATVKSGGKIVPPLATKQTGTQTIGFDEFTANAYNQIASGYAGLNWTNFNTINGNVAGGIYQIAMQSAPNVAFNQSTTPATISSPSPFELVSLYMTAINSNETVTIDAYKGTTLADVQTITPSTSSSTLYTLDFSGITSVTFTPTVPSGDPFIKSMGGIVAIDNVKIQRNAYFGQAYAAGLSLNSGGTYDWQLGGLLDNSTGTSGADFAAIQANGGNLSLGGTSKININLVQLAAGDVPGGANNNPFWNSSHIWTVATVTNGATNTGSTNFAAITNGSYSTGGFATQLNPDGQSIDLVYNEMNLTSGSANNSVLGKITLSKTGGQYTPVVFSAGNVTLGSVDIAGLAQGYGPLQVQLDVKGTASSINQWYMELSESQAGGPAGYTIVSGSEFGTAPSGDSAYIFTFNGLSTSADTYINFDWTAGNSGVTLDQIVVPVPEPSSLFFLAMAALPLMTRRRIRTARAFPPYLRLHR
jgi:hypothetical protein